MSTDEPIRAAGGVVWRPSEWLPGKADIVLVHRPSYDDWTLPKGKAEKGETDEETALREVREETGLACELGPELPSTRYLDRYGKPKIVRYWLMTPLSGELKPSQEVDAARWIMLMRARQMLTYERDYPVLDGLAEVLPEAR